MKRKQAYLNQDCGFCHDSVVSARDDDDDDDADDDDDGKSSKFITFRNHQNSAPINTTSLGNDANVLTVMSLMRELSL